MKLKTLKKKIRRLEKRLREGPAKLARLRRNLEAMEAEKKAGRSSGAIGARGQGHRAPAKGKRKLNLSPERRAQLSAAMKARWAARRATAETIPQPVAVAQYPASEAIPAREITIQSV